MAYEIAIALHVVVAIVGVGQVTGLTVVAAIAKRSPAVAPATWAALKQLARGASWSLGLMLLTGVWLEALAGGVHGRSVWFPVAFVLFLACGALLGMTQRALRKCEAKAAGTEAGATEGEAAGNVSVLSGTLTRGAIVCGLVAIIATLMQLKPW